jgi:hypothetical protein
VQRVFKIHLPCHLGIIINIIVIIGSTALRRPLPSSEASASFHPAIASSDFVTRVFQGGVVSPTPNPRLF